MFNTVNTEVPVLYWNTETVQFDLIQFTS